jgi:hypothetical protein
MLFYPGFYVYCVWGAWYYAKPNANKTTTAIPFLIGGFLGEIGAIFAPKFPMPTLMVGMLMIIPMLIGMWIFRKQPFYFSYGLPVKKLWKIKRPNNNNYLASAENEQNMLHIQCFVINQQYSIRMMTYNL